MPNARRVKIVLLEAYGANRMASWRGVIRNLSRSLRARGADVHCVSHHDSFVGMLFKIKQYLIRNFIGRKYSRHREPYLIAEYGRRSARAARRIGADIAIGLKAIPVAKMHTDIPVVLYNDSTFGGLLNFYGEFTGMSPASVAAGEAMEHAAALTVTHSIYSSDWGLRRAVSDYGVSPDAVTMIEMGANLEVHHDAADVVRFADRRLRLPVWEFLWLGVEWERKRGAFAVDVVQELARRGYPVHLTVAGVSGEGRLYDANVVDFPGFLDADEIARRLPDTHFLLLPTKADCTPIVYCEANAFGVPVLSTDVGGITTVIREPHNGLLFSLEDPVERWADRIAALIDEPAHYREMALASFEEYRTRLNWDTASHKIMAILERLLSAGPSGQDRPR